MAVAEGRKERTGTQINDVRAVRIGRRQFIADKCNPAALLNQVSEDRSALIASHYMAVKNLHLSPPAS